MTAKKRLNFVFIMLVLTILACTVNVGGPAYPDKQIPVSSEAVDQMKQHIQEAITAESQSGQVTFIINEIQITSFLALELQKQSDPIITDPQVYLQDEQIQIYGTATSGYFTATARIVLAASADTDGELIIDLVEADFGPLPVPDQLKDAITAIISEAYTGALGPIATGFRIEAIVIAEGMMAITGRIK